MRLFFEDEEQMQVFFDSGDFASALAAYLPNLRFLDKEQIVIFHFWNPNCRCDIYNMQHVKALRREYGDKLHLLVVSAASNHIEYQQQWQDLQTDYQVEFIQYNALNLPVVLPATPSVAVVQASGELSYFGPYAVGGLCLPGENSIVEGVLDSILAGNPLRYPFSTGFGCYCPWPQQTQYASLEKS
jgi:hypothetical protein